MTTAGKDWGRLASYVSERMKTEKIRTKAELRRRTGLSIPTVMAILDGAPRGGDMSDDTLGKLDDGLRWGDGSSADILAGGEPVVLDAPSAGGDVSQLDARTAAQLRADIAAVNARVDGLEAALHAQTVAQVAQLEALADEVEQVLQEPS